MSLVVRARFPGEVGGMVLPTLGGSSSGPCTPATMMDKLVGQQALHSPSGSLAVHLEHTKKTT